MTNQNDFIHENDGNNIQVPGMALRSNAGLPDSKQKTYKSRNIQSSSNFRIVSMNPGDRKVAGCLMFSGTFGGLSSWKTL